MYTTAVIQMFADVGGVIVDIVQFNAQFPLNGIPTATALLPVGREVKSLMVGTAHALSGATDIQIPTMVWIKVSYGSGNTSGILPVGTYLMFYGWTTWVGYRQAYNGISMALEMTHWLSALNSSSILSASTHPKNPSQPDFNAAMKLGSSNGGALLSSQLTSPFFTPAKVAADLWGQGILPWFKALAGTDLLDPVNFDARSEHHGSSHKNDSVNNDCMTALNLFEGDRLPFNLPSGGEASAATALSAHIGSATLTPGDAGIQELSQTTFWDKLIQLASIYRFAIVPMPHKALVVPFIAGLRYYWDPWGLSCSVLARDISMLDTNSGLSRPLRAVGVFANRGNLVSDNGAFAIPADSNGNISWYVGRDDGLIMYADAPAFAAVEAGMYAKKTAPVIHASAMHPTGGAASTIPKPRVVKEKMRDMLDRTAHAIYVTELLRTRTGKLSGPLRFDICPGSTIKIESTAGVFTQGYDAMGTTHYASVHRVNYAIDAHNAKASTTFDLAHFRSEEESRDDNTSIAIHPYYNRRWVGDYMLAGF